MLKKNGYVLEQLLSPLIVFTTPEHEELKAIATGCITKHHAHHYLGFSETQWKLFQKADPPHVKPLLYVYRITEFVPHEYSAKLTGVSSQERFFPDVISVSMRYGSRRK